VTLRTAPDTYAFDNDDADAADRHRHLAGVLDGFTCARLSRLGDLTGWRCLELGAGGGSVAAWLADRVGPAGHVTATDVNIRHLPTDAGYAVLEHDLATEPPPAGPWDLIHARLVLVHVKNQREVMRQLVDTLAPGGVLAIEEWDGTLGHPMLAGPDPEAGALFDSYTRAVRDILAAGGNDAHWARKVHGIMLDDGLIDVDTELHARSWSGGSAGALLNIVNIGQLGAELRAAGLTDVQLDRLRALMRDPRLVLRGLVTYSTIGRRPG
jgi:SAM-dependent methyltransferase